MLAKVQRKLRQQCAEVELGAQLARVEDYLAATPRPASDSPPVLFFNASTRIHRLSLNAAFSLLTAWGLRARGDSVRYVVCQKGMVQCVLGALWAEPLSPPPCGPCTAYSRKLFASDWNLPLNLDTAVADRASSALADRSLAELQAWEWQGLAMGQLCLASVRWVCRRHHLHDDQLTRGLYRRYLASAASLAVRLDALLERWAPRALVVFNGLTYPEAIARELARRRGVPVITHEVGLRPFSAFFSHREATFREVELPEGARLSAKQDEDLDAYLEDRRLGKFSMAGINFWPSITELPEPLSQAAADGRGIVTIFTNVAFDTSQVHANTIFDDMFDWLDELVDVFRLRSETLFVIRAHPDENRPGKASRESVADWAEASGVTRLPNVVFFPPSEYVNSYELIRASRFVLVYSSSVGLEASIQGTPVLSAGRSRYTQSPTVILPESRSAYRQELDSLLRGERIPWPPSYSKTARAFLHTELSQASLDFSDFLTDYPEAPGMVSLRKFDPELLGRHATLEVIRHGILEGAPFLMNEHSWHDGARP